MKNKKILATITSIALLAAISATSASAYSESFNGGTIKAVLVSKSTAYASTYYAPGSLNIFRKVEATFHYMDVLSSQRLSFKKARSIWEGVEVRVDGNVDGTFQIMESVSSTHTIGTASTSIYDN